MLRGSHQARIDEKGRLKVPSQFRSFIEERYGQDLFVTSVNGESARIYPMKAWEEIEARLIGIPSSNPSRQRFLDAVNYFGQAAEIDAQGRVLIHPRLRDAAQIVGEVEVMGALTYLSVWNRERFESRRASSPLTEADLEELARHGV